MAWGDSMWVFGGETMSAVTNDLYTFSFGVPGPSSAPQRCPRLVSLQRCPVRAVAEWQRTLAPEGGVGWVDHRPKTSAPKIKQ